MPPAEPARTPTPGQTVSNRPQDVAYAILHGRPATSAAAVEAARTIAADISGLRSLSVGDQAIGWAINAKLDPSGGGHPSGVSNPALAQAAQSLTGGQLALPPHETLSLAITPIRDLGNRGPVDRDINGETPSGGNRGPFDVEKLDNRSAYKLANWPML